MTENNNKTTTELPDYITNISVELVDSMGSDLSVVDAARVSFAKTSDWDIDPETAEKMLKAGDQKLIKYLADHNHFTPFCHAFLTFRIKTSYAMARQLVKHQVGLAWNEQSRRYLSGPPEFYLPDEWRGKPVNSKQGSSDEIMTHFVLDGVPVEITPAVLGIYEQAYKVYNALIDSKICPEQARFILPLGGMTEWIWSGSLMAFARVCKLRLDSHAQKEVRDVAQKIDELIPKEFQHSWKALTGR